MDFTAGILSAIPIIVFMFIIALCVVKLMPRRRTRRSFKLRSIMRGSEETGSDFTATSDPDDATKRVLLESEPERVDHTPNVERRPHHSPIDEENEGEEDVDDDGDGADVRVEKDGE
jgi:hypothetical protein